MGLNINEWRAIGASETVIKWLVDGIKIYFINNPETFQFNNKQFNPTLHPLRERVLFGPNAKFSQDWTELTHSSQLYKA